MHFIKDIESGKKKCKFSVFIYVNIDMYVHVCVSKLYLLYIYLALLKSTMPRQNPSIQSYHTITLFSIVYF